MRSKKSIVLMFTMMLVLLLAGCLNNSTPASKGDSSSSSNSGSGGESFNWRMASVWAEGSLQYEQDERFVNLVNQLSNGRLNIKLHSVGELAPANQVLDLVSGGTVEMGGDWPNYWSGKNTAFELLGSQAMGLTNWDYFLWINQGGGMEAYNEIYGKFNTIYFPHSISGMESGIRSNKPIESLEDLKGMKIRMAGLIQSELIKQLGATPVTLATQEIYEALQRGVIDAAEYSSPYSDEVTKMYEVTKYWLTPGFHQTSSIYGAMINKDAWAKLPEDLQAVVEKASKAAQTENASQYAFNDAEAAQRMVNEYGIETTELSDEEMAKLHDMVSAIVEKLASENPDFEKVLNNQLEYLKMYAPYRDLQGDWSFGNNSKVAE
ncbi:TRAP transporter substrate-binding protein DctP [Bacillus sp. ISL-47]|uniref:TRAP transporter substrate-binding protein n=1 Tax=Bacillus sp. ISL-47 TaxID=2819130 RepID=UPI001BEA66D1|nr:TRAP transporter substrate-binding protein DctP [Bacillus sp. ISL-47]MBT2690642.1 TRAP transporter substrate-binding protein DctP [Bacillus sp. ISL-47]MBT2710825.1 TRAP transporter substrate-binding protein DctP [Pseudomonas sp. ISL-84]